jgi:4-alpha-glucanotransferase
MGPRAAGILLHPTSLPGPFGIGDLGPSLDRFLDWMASAGQTVWQVLPLGPTSIGNSPYGCASAFAGNPLLISPELLAAEGLLPGEALRSTPAMPEEHVDFGAVIRWKERMLRASWERFRAHASHGQEEAFRSFRAAPAQEPWLWDWTMFAALKQREGGREWSAWGPALTTRSPDALSLTESRLSGELEFHAYAQFLFCRQWERARREAAARGIRILGDIPIYVAPDSADVWANQELFQLDEQGRQTAQAGVPPDYFSATGQLWGNPLYRWDVLERDGFRWWIDRVRANLRLCDAMRVDHFRGFAGYWSVPAGEKTAIGGQWVPGPGAGPFRAIRSALGELPLVAEDLGVITEDVKALLAELGLPGMRVLQFGFFNDDSLHLPHRHAPGTVVYTGTHDNDTSRGWWASLDEDSRTRAVEYLGCTGEEIEWTLIHAAYESVAQWAIVPMQDVLGLESGARMNTPSRSDGNWVWRLPPEGLRGREAERLARLAHLTGRAPA